MKVLDRIREIGGFWIHDNLPPRGRVDVVGLSSGDYMLR